MAVCDEEFAKIPKDFVGVLEWRIENFRLVPQETLGKFHTDDSYVVFHAYTKDQRRYIYRDIFFWLGSTSTSDERGTAAIKTIELDMLYDGQPVEYREVQYHESEKFIRLFDEFGGLEYLDGGVPCAFRKIVTEKPVDMFRIKGSRMPIIEQIAPMRSNLCHGNCYIVHTPGFFYLWIGKNSSKMERHRAGLAVDIMQQRDPRSRKIRVEQGEEDDDLNALIGTEGEIMDDDGDDKAWENNFRKQIYDKDLNLVAEGANFKEDALVPGHISYIVFGEKIFVYVAKKTPAEEKRVSMADAMKLLEKVGLPDHAFIELYNEGAEDDDFCFVFH